MSRNRRVQVPEDGAGLRLDQFLSTLEGIPSRARALELIQAGCVRVISAARNAKALLRPSNKLNLGDWIEVDFPEPKSSALVPSDEPLDIVFQDRDVAVINKPSGLVVHPAAGHAQDTLVNRLLHHLDQLSMGFGEERPGVVHRLDRDTSGLLVVAKNDAAHHHLAAQFRAKTAHRLYWAIVNGIPRPAAGTYRTHLGRHPRDRKRYASVSGGAQGKLAVTHYTLLGYHASNVAWVECRLETGRTHQIRVHLSEAGWPIVADPIYGLRRPSAADKKTPRLALHAHTLGFTHPRTGDAMKFEVGWPDDLKLWEACTWSK